MYCRDVYHKSSKYNTSGYGSIFINYSNVNCSIAIKVKQKDVW